MRYLNGLLTSFEITFILCELRTLYISYTWPKIYRRPQDTIYNSVLNSNIQYCRRSVAISVSIVPQSPLQYRDETSTLYQEFNWLSLLHVGVRKMIDTEHGVLSILNTYFLFNLLIELRCKIIWA